MLNNSLFSESTQPYVNVINLRRLTILKKQAFMDFHKCLLLFCCLYELKIKKVVFMRKKGTEKSLKKFFDISCCITSGNYI